MAKTQTAGGRLRVLRDTLGITQSNLAQAMGVSQVSTVSRWENDKAPPDRGALRLAADLCHDSRAVYAWLVHGKEQPPILSILTPRPPTAWEAGELEALLSRAAESLAGVTRKMDGVAYVPAGVCLHWCEEIRRAAHRA